MIGDLLTFVTKHEADGVLSSLSGYQPNLDRVIEGDVGSARSRLSAADGHPPRHSGFPDDGVDTTHLGHGLTLQVSGSLADPGQFFPRRGSPLCCTGGAGVGAEDGKIEEGDVDPLTRK